MCQKNLIDENDPLNQFNSYLMPDPSVKEYENLIAKVGDFGIAGIKRAGTKGEDTNAGTVKFMAPELQTGDAIEANSALDIWAIGIMLYMMIYGEHPFKKHDRAETVKSIIEDPVKFDETPNISEE